MFVKIHSHTTYIRLSVAVHIFLDGAIETYVEVNEVRAKILMGDICVRNGIIHKIDRVLGFPTLLLWDEISETSDLE